MRALKRSAFRRHGLGQTARSWAWGTPFRTESLVVYYPHLLVCPSSRVAALDGSLMKRLNEAISRIHQHILVAEGKAVSFYRKCRVQARGQNRFDVGVQGLEHG